MRAASPGSHHLRHDVKGGPVPDPPKREARVYSRAPIQLKISPPLPFDRRMRQDSPDVERARTHPRATSPPVEEDPPPPMPPAYPTPARRRQPQVYPDLSAVTPMREQERVVPRRQNIAIAPAAQKISRPFPRAEAINPRLPPARGDPLRKPLENSCYVCYEDFDDREEAVWCRRCGQNLHVDCLRDWSAGKRRGCAF